MLNLRRILAICIGTLFSFSSLAGIYQWTDESGKVHFSDKMPESMESGKMQIKTIQLEETNDAQVTSRFGLPGVERLQPIHYTGYDKPLAFSLSGVGFNLENADYQRVQIGRILSGNNCEREVRQIYWNDGNGYFNSGNINGTIINEINKAGYNLTDSTYTEVNSRLTLKALLLKMDLVLCHKKRNDPNPKNDSYIQVKWELYDKLLRENVYSGTSEGSSINPDHKSENKTEFQAVNSAIAIATTNLLADPQFVAHVNTAVPPKPVLTNFDSLSIELSYANHKSSFREQLTSLQNSTTTVRNSEGHGSGVVISSDGHILTNAHVVGKDSELIVIYNNHEYIAKVVRQEPVRDIALLKIDAPSKLATSNISKDIPEVGDKLFAIGSPLSEALSHTVTSGILSANRTMYGLDYYQTDTSINPGNSGGPVYNEAGELIAISVSGVFSSAGAGVGINYLIPINDAFNALSIKTRPAALTTQKVIPTGINEITEPNLLDKALAIFSSDETTTQNLQITPNSNWDTAYEFYKQGLDAKENRNFDNAEELLLRAVSSIQQDDFSDDAYLVRDELYFHLPIAKATYLIQELQPKQAKIPVKHVHQYLADHPRRFEYMAQINQINSSIEGLEISLSNQAKAQLAPVRLLIMEYYSQRGKLPENVASMAKLLNDQMGRQFSNKFQLLDYKLVNGQYVFLFQDLKRFEKHELFVAVY